jgi:hypothetical protein
VLEKIVAEIAINLCTDCFANIAKIDNANIDIVKLGFAHGEGINFRQRDRNFSARAKTPPFLRQFSRRVVSRVPTKAAKCPHLYPK